MKQFSFRSPRLLLLTCIYFVFISWLRLYCFCSFRHFGSNHSILVATDASIIIPLSLSMNKSWNNVTHITITNPHYALGCAWSVTYLGGEIWNRWSEFDFWIVAFIFALMPFLERHESFSSSIYIRLHKVDCCPKWKIPVSLEWKLT